MLQSILLAGRRMACSRPPDPVVTWPNLPLLLVASAPLLTMRWSGWSRHAEQCDQRGGGGEHAVPSDFEAVGATARKYHSSCIHTLARETFLLFHGGDYFFVKPMVTRLWLTG